MKNIIIIDIDHVLSNAFPRDTMIDGKNWDDYHSASEKDAPVVEMRHITNQLYNSGFDLIGLTARPEKWRALTVKWLAHQKFRLDRILMRPDDCYLAAPDCKISLVEAAGIPFNDILAVFDDRSDVCAAFCERGVLALQVYAEGVCCATAKK